MSAKAINKIFKLIYSLYLASSALLLVLFSINYFHDHDQFRLDIIKIEIFIISIVISILFFLLRNSANKTSAILKIMLIVSMVLLPFYYYSS